MDSKWFLESKRVQGAAAALIGFVAALYGLDLTDSQAVQYAGDGIAAVGVAWHLYGQYTKSKPLRLRRKPRGH